MPPKLGASIRRPPRTNLVRSTRAPGPRVPRSIPKGERNLPCGIAAPQPEGGGGSWVSGRERPGRRLQGAAVEPFVRWGWGRAEVSPIAAQAAKRATSHVALSRRGLDAREHQRPADQPLSEHVLKERA